METRVCPVAVGSSPSRAANLASVVISRVAESWTVEARLTWHVLEDGAVGCKDCRQADFRVSISAAIAGIAPCGLGKKQGVYLLGKKAKVLMINRGKRKEISTIFFCRFSADSLSQNCIMKAITGRRGRRSNLEQ